MRPIPQSAFFTARDAYACGWTPSALRHATAAHVLVRHRRGVYSRSSVVMAPYAAGAVAATLTRGGAVVSHRSAALLHGLPVIGRRVRRPEVTVAPRSSANLPGIDVHRATLLPAHVTEVNGITVTTPARTVLDIARSGSLLHAVATMDAALHRGAANLDDLDAILRDCRRWPGIRNARRARDAADGRAESVLESVSRLRMEQMNIAHPTLQQPIFDQYGRLIARVDFYWDELGVYGEADGRLKYADADALWQEKEREDHLARLGLVAARWGWDDAWRHPQRVADRVRSAFERGAARDRSGLPRLWSL